MQAFRPGFRFSLTDGVILAAGAAAAMILGSESTLGAVVISFVVGHFFLFCNVFRISRPLELIWAGVFVVLAGKTIVTGLLGWGVALGVAGVMTVVVIAIETRQPSYHGVGWQRINPALPQWWERGTSASRPGNHDRTH